MTLPTIRQLYEEYDGRDLITQVTVGGALLPDSVDISYGFEESQVPTATIVCPRASLPAAVVPEAQVEIWMGFRVGMVALGEIVYGGAIVDGIGREGPNVTINCVQDGARRLTYAYNRTIAFDFDNVTAVDAATALLNLAGVPSFFVDLDPWDIGTAVPYTAALKNQLQFSTYGEAVNKVATVDGSPWYALPTGQIRVERRDPIPADTPRRTYFSSILSGPDEALPTAITNTRQRPRILDINSNLLRADVSNWVEIDGAVLHTLGPNGEDNANQIVEEVDGLSGSFDNGAAWIPTPPLFQQFVFANELIDTDAKSFTVAERYYALKNRLIDSMTITIPADPDIFLGETVRIIDNYTKTDDLYFVKAYRTNLSDGQATTELTLLGGHYAGTAGHAAPFAEFVWTYQALHRSMPGGKAGGTDNVDRLNLGPMASLGAKLCLDVPEDTGDPDKGGDLPPGEDKAMVLINFDGSPSKDFDGEVVAWAWSDDAGHSASGPQVTILYDPNVSSAVQMTLTVYDDTARTSTITKTVYTNADANPSPPPPDGDDPKMNDTPQGGGIGNGPCAEPDGDVPGLQFMPGGQTGMRHLFYVAAKAYAMAGADAGGFNDLAKADAGASGDFISVDAAIQYQRQDRLGIFGTDQGEIMVTTDLCLSGSVVFQVPGAPRIECIHIDEHQSGSFGPGPQDNPFPGVPVYTAGSPGTLTIVEAFQQCLNAGFDRDRAVIATAIMIRESGLQSNATHTNTDGSIDRGIAQFNNVYHPEVSDACAFDTACAIGEMFRVSVGGVDFGAWSTYVGRTYLAHLQEVLDAIGGFGLSPDTPFDLSFSLRVWAGTSDGRIYVSEDSGQTWSLWVNFGDGFPVYEIGTPPKFGARTFSLWAFGGDTGHPETLIRIDAAKNRQFAPLLLGGDLGRAIIAAGPGHSLRASSMNDTSSLVGFTGGVSPLVWTSRDPIGDPASWVPTSGILDTTIDDARPGFGGEYVVAGNFRTSQTVDDESFVPGTIPASRIRGMAWQGLEGAYAAAAEGGIYQTVDSGTGWGKIRPNATFGTTWPAGAFGYQIAFCVGPNTVDNPTPPSPPPPVFAWAFPEAVWPGNQGGAQQLAQGEVWFIRFGFSAPEGGSLPADPYPDVNGDVDVYSIGGVTVTMPYTAGLDYHPSGLFPDPEIERYVCFVVVGRGPAPTITQPAPGPDPQFLGVRVASGVDVVSPIVGSGVDGMGIAAYANPSVATASTSVAGSDPTDLVLCYFERGEVVFNEDIIGSGISALSPDNTPPLSRIHNPLTSSDIRDLFGFASGNGIAGQDGTPNNVNDATYTTISQKPLYGIPDGAHSGVKAVLFQVRLKQRTV